MQLFVTKDMGKPRCFFEIVVVYKKIGMFLSQRKYVLDLLQVTGVLRCKLLMHLWRQMWTFKVKIVKLMIMPRNIGEQLENLSILRLLEQIFFYCLVTQSVHSQVKRDSLESYSKDSCICQEFSKKRLLYKKHCHIHIHVYSDAEYGEDRGEMKSTTGYLTSIGANLVTWLSKKTRCILVKRCGDF